MTIEPTITCPNCSTEIKLTESLAAPLIQATRKEFQAKIADQEKAVAQREEDIRKAKKEIQDAQARIDEQVSEKLKAERASIIEEEKRKAKLAAASEMEDKVRELSELQDVLKDRDEKLKEAQKAQAELIRKQRELDDAKRELDLTVEKRVRSILVRSRNIPRYLPSSSHALTRDADESPFRASSFKPEIIICNTSMRCWHKPW